DEFVPGVTREHFVHPSGRSVPVSATAAKMQTLDQNLLPVVTLEADFHLVDPYSGQALQLGIGQVNLHDDGPVTRPLLIGDGEFDFLFFHWLRLWSQSIQSQLV